MNDPHRYFCAAAMPDGVVGFRAKQTYPSRQAAAEAGHRNVEPYHCRRCGLWHLASVKRKKRRRMP